MEFSLEEWLIGGGILLLLSVIASRVSDKLGIPALLLFLAVGMLAGSDGPGRIYFDDAQLAQGIGVAALAFILFAGGLETDFRSVRPVIGPALALAIGGVFITALLVGLFAVWVVQVSLLQGLLLGAIVSATDAAAVFAVLRSSGIHLKGQLQPLIELESGSNDPMAVFLTIGVVRLITYPQTSGLDLIAIFFQQMLLGAVLGYAAGLFIVWLINHLRLQADGLYPVLLVALVLLTYGTTAFFGGSGFLAVYLAGLVVGNRNIVHKRSLLHFQDGLAWLMQIVMFLVLGLLVFPSHLVPVFGSGLLLALFLVLIARPVSVFAVLGLTRYNWREKALVSWVGLRGAVPIILATFPLLAGVPQATSLFNLVFFIVLTSALLQGPLISQVARWLKLEDTATPAYHNMHEFVPQIGAGNQLLELIIPPHSPVHGKSILDLGLPAGALVVLLHRHGDGLVPNGGTILHAEDRLLVLGDADSLSQAQTILVSPGASARNAQPSEDPDRG